jgi:acyl-CoA thioester hydrolase
MLVVQKSVAHPWMCDVLGHMTTRFYLNMFDDASYHLLYGVFGWAGASDDKGEFGWADVRHIIDYVAEVNAGDVLETKAGIGKIGNKSITIRYEMMNLGEDELAATLECTCVLFDLKARKAVPLTDALRERASAHLIEAEEE